MKFLNLIPKQAHAAGMGGCKRSVLTIMQNLGRGNSSPAAKLNPAQPNTSPLALFQNTLVPLFLVL